MLCTTVVVRDCDYDGLHVVVLCLCKSSIIIIVQAILSQHVKCASTAIRLHSNQLLYVTTSQPAVVCDYTAPH